LHCERLPSPGAARGWMSAWMGLPAKQGLYDPRNEHDACGVGFVANIKGEKSHDIIRRGLQILVNLDHRGG
jgi:glutamate synthase (NADPH) large chain